MEITPKALEQEFSLQTAATRLDFLSRRDSGSTSLNTARDRADDDWSSLLADDTSLDVPESLELLALGEVIARKAHDSQLTGFRAALRGGAGWEQIAAALDVTPAQAWTRFQEAVEQQERSAALTPGEAASARELAGARPAG
ncbi:hypothetical protein SAMN05660464_3482 [Geodermatophilus dictyosporus]|uniref:Uncharacterized protein n=1 Tax=Geodermatophilus dictyosporus TaxID=1523247 RepID=A0A1I5R4U4_9ACTN|nr:hypothetical protein [Geodermatophilus dictyosporus]SFP53523.1 hypothetical protein SAMN05660464_3482 [Geodermatophilus dictyosporus]